MTEDEIKQLDMLISFWESTLDEYRFLINISSQYLIEKTIALLKGIKDESK